jgi:hypothetical protein
MSLEVKALLIRHHQMSSVDQPLNLRLEASSAQCHRLRHNQMFLAINKALFLDRTQPPAQQVVRFFRSRRSLHRHPQTFSGEQQPKLQRQRLLLEVATSLAPPNRVSKRQQVLSLGVKALSVVDNRKQLQLTFLAALQVLHRHSDLPASLGVVLLLAATLLVELDNQVSGLQQLKAQLSVNNLHPSVVKQRSVDKQRLAVPKEISLVSKPQQQQVNRTASSNNLDHSKAATCSAISLRTLNLSKLHQHNKVVSAAVHFLAGVNFIFCIAFYVDRILNELIKHPTLNSISFYFCSNT